MGAGAKERRPSDHVKARQGWRALLLVLNDVRQGEAV